MDVQTRIEQSLERALSFAAGGNKPKILCDALRYAVFPGGARIRPRLCHAVAYSCSGGKATIIPDAAASAIELIHCASLVHDDLPCFDDADLRRGKPSVHAAFGEPIAVLTGDALLVLAFETIARECAVEPDKTGPLISILAQATGMPNGIIAGQAFESEPITAFEEYHRAKTTSLFACATIAGAIAAGQDPAPWRGVGEALGNAYQVADDLRDVAATESEMGKPCGQDQAHNRPSAVTELGVAGAIAQLMEHVHQAVEAIPPCPGSSALEELIKSEAKRLQPKGLAQVAA